MNPSQGTGAGARPDIAQGESSPFLTEHDAPLFRIDRGGQWHYRDSPIQRERLVKLFAGVLRREGEAYWLVTPVERARVIVDDAPFIVTEAHWRDGAEGLEVAFTTNLGDTIRADYDHPIRVEIEPDTQEPRPYVLVRGGLEALIARGVFYDLVDRGEERIVNGARVLGVLSAGIFFTLGPVGAEA